MNFDLEWKLELFRAEQRELFDDEGKRYYGVDISYRESELMLEIINELEDELLNLEKQYKQLSQTSSSSAKVGSFITSIASNGVRGAATSVVAKQVGKLIEEKILR